MIRRYGNERRKRARHRPGLPDHGQGLPHRGSDEHAAGYHRAARPGNTQAPQAHWPGRNRGGGGVIGATHRTGTIRTAAFTLVSNANGTATLTINPKVLLDASTLQSDLKQDGIPAMVTVGSFCSSDPPPAGFLRVVSFQPKTQGSGRQPVADPTVTFHPSAMPARAELSFGNFQLASSQQTSFTLIDTGSYTCTSTAPTAPPFHGVMLTYGRPAS
jgi:hypothetical protein